MNNKDLIAQYVDTGLLLPEHQVVQLPNWALKSYLRKRLIAIGSGGKRLQDYEFRVMSTDYKDKYVKDIVHSKNQLRLHEYEYASDDLKNMFLDYSLPLGVVYPEIVLTLPDNRMVEYIDGKIKRSGSIHERVFNGISDKFKLLYLNKMFKNRYAYSQYPFKDYEFDFAPEELKKNIIQFYGNLPYQQFSQLTDDWKKYYLEYKVSKDVDITFDEFNWMDSIIGKWAKVKYLINASRSQLHRLNIINNFQIRDLYEIFDNGEFEGSSDLAYKILNEFGGSNIEKPRTYLFSFLDNKLKLKHMLDNPYDFYLFKEIPDEVLIAFVKEVPPNFNFSQQESTYNSLPDEAKLIHLTRKYKQGWPLTDTEQDDYNRLTNEQ